MDSKWKSRIGCILIASLEQKWKSRLERIRFAVAASSESARDLRGWLPLRAANRIALEFIKETADEEAQSTPTVRDV